MFDGVCYLFFKIVNWGLANCLFCSYELPDGHPILSWVSILFFFRPVTFFIPVKFARKYYHGLFGLYVHFLIIVNSQLEFEERDPDDPSPYLLILYSPGVHLNYLNLNGYLQMQL